MKMKKYIPVILTFTPLFAFALAPGFCSSSEGIIGLICYKIFPILDVVVPLLIAVAVVIFLVGVVKYITAGGEEEKRTEARNVMVYGIVGLFVMVAVWGLVNLLLGTFDLDRGAPDYPQL